MKEEQWVAIYKMLDRLTLPDRYPIPLINDASFGLWKCSKMPFQLKKAGCTFQRVIHEGLHDIPFIFCYIDDILVSIPTIEDHEPHLREVFTRICENNLMVNLDKCVHANPTMTFLSHTVDSKGIPLLPEKVAPFIQQFP